MENLKLKPRRAIKLELKVTKVASLTARVNDDEIQAGSLSCITRCATCRTRGNCCSKNYSCYC